MPIEYSPLVLVKPALTIAQSKAVQRKFRRVTRYLVGRKPIVVAGRPGGGKTVLSDHLTGRADAPGYEYGGRSRSIENGRFKRQVPWVKAPWRTRVIVLPGEMSRDSTARNWTRRNYEGLIYVTSAGLNRHAPTLGPDFDDIGAESLDDFRRREYDNEIEHLESLTVTLLNMNKRPRWVLVVVNKYDLWRGPGEDSVVNHYSSGAFKEQVMRLANTIGTENVRIEVVASMSADDNFKVGEDMIESHANAEEIGVYTTNVMQRVVSLSRATNG